MTYRSQGRTMTEVIVAVTFVSFLTGFVAVLCIGNYFRAKKAQERQRQQRLARLAGGSGLIDDSSSPRSHYSGSSVAGGGQQSSSTTTDVTSSSGVGVGVGEQQHLLSQSSRQRRSSHPMEEGTDSLLLKESRAMHV